MDPNLSLSPSRAPRPHPARLSTLSAPPSVTTILADFLSEHASEDAPHPKRVRVPAPEEQSPTEEHDDGQSDGAPPSPVSPSATRAVPKRSSMRKVSGVGLDTERPLSLGSPARACAGSRVSWSASVKPKTSPRAKRTSLESTSSTGTKRTSLESTSSTGSTERTLFVRSHKRTPSIEFLQAGAGIAPLMKSRVHRLHRKKTLEVDFRNKSAFDRYREEERVRYAKEQAADEAAKVAASAAAAAVAAEAAYEKAIGPVSGSDLDLLLRRKVSAPAFSGSSTTSSRSRSRAVSSAPKPKPALRASKPPPGSAMVAAATKKKSRRRGPSAPPPPSASIMAKAKAAAVARATAEAEKVAADMAAKEAARPKPLTASQIERRTERGTGKRTMLDDGIRLHYAWQTQRGYYPSEPRKKNQDSVLVVEEMAIGVADGRPAFFGVFDGHGKYGDKTSNYVRDNIEAFLRDAVGEDGVVSDVSDGSPFDMAYSAAYETCNQCLHDNKRIDDSVSGTTAVSAWIQGSTIKVANIGDSRVVVARWDEGKGQLVAVALSRDQTPYRRDERERCKAAGARVMSMDMLDGIVPMSDDWGDDDVKLGEVVDTAGDPPRIWHPTEKYPGNAFTRSVGDALSEPMGVFGTPEISTYELDDCCEFLIVASDGIWEFLTNQAVVDAAAQFRDPVEACDHLVKQAYHAWLDNEVRTDDISCIVVHVFQEGAGGGRGRKRSTGRKRRG